MKKNSISKNIRYYRHEKGLTQQQLAEKVGVSWEMISRYERGESSPLSRMNELSEALDVDMNTLLNEKPTELSHKQIEYFDIPYFAEIPENKQFAASKTHEFYKSPVWMKARDKDIFAISPSIIRKLPLQLDQSGPIFISPNTKPNETSLILIITEDKLDVIGSKELQNDHTTLGTIIAQEKRFV